MNHKKRLLTCLAMAILAGGCIKASNNLTMVVGTYTEQSPSKGIYVMLFDQITGTAQPISSIKASNPSFLTISNDATHVYAVKEYADNRRGASAYTLDLAKGTMTQINSQECGTLAKTQTKGTPGADPCNIMLYGNHVVTSNYTGGDISVFPVASDGSLRPEAQYKNLYIGGNVDAHIHCCHMTPDKNFVMATDLGNDCIWMFKANNKSENFLGKAKVAYKAPKGTGPRHFVFNQKGTIAYLIGELDGTVTVLGYHNGKLNELQRVQASQTKTNGSADIHISPDGKFLYASHRLKDEGISIFSIDQNNGLVKKIGFQPTAAHPRNFAITPNGKYLLVACRDSNVIEVYKRDANTGMLTSTMHDIKMGKPVCIQFAPIPKTTCQNVR